MSADQSAIDAARHETGGHVVSRAVPAVRAATIVALVVGVVCQFVQRTDSTPAWLYFTVDSATLLACALAVLTLRPRWRWLEHVRGAVSVGVLLSGAVFATVIAPSTDTGSWIQPDDDIPVRIANVALHGLAPALVAADFVLSSRPTSAPPLLVATAWCAWPLTYLAALTVVERTGAGTAPYPFLDRHAVGGGVVVAALTGLFVLTVALGVGLQFFRDRLTP